MLFNVFTRLLTVTKMLADIPQAERQTHIPYNRTRLDQTQTLFLTFRNRSGIRSACLPWHGARIMCLNQTFW